jgi:ketosteroid isomerase-like protein
MQCRVASRLALAFAALAWSNRARADGSARARSTMTMIQRRHTLGGALAALSLGALAVETPLKKTDAVAAVRARELAFARTMAERDFNAFADFVSPEAVFLGGAHPLVGRAAIAAHWARFYQGGTAPFSWQPDEVVAHASGTLAHSTGPVTDAQGQGGSRFYTVWRLEGDGQWRAVFDNGYRVCAADPPVGFNEFLRHLRGRLA